MSDDRHRPRHLLVTMAVLTIIFVLIAADLASDYDAGIDGSHLAAEVIVMLLCLMGVATLWASLRTARGRVMALRTDVEASRREAAQWRARSREMLHGLAYAMDDQFDRWELTAAERSIALSLLRGMSHKEIAAARHTSERTVREQSRSVYHKAGLSGRSELAGFFLSDLITTRNP